MGRFGFACSICEGRLPFLTNGNGHEERISRVRKLPPSFGTDRQVSGSLLTATNRLLNGGNGRVV